MRWDWGRAVRLPARSRRHARDALTGAANRRGRWRYDRVGRWSGPGSKRPAAHRQRAPRSRGRGSVSLSGLPYSHQYTLILGALLRRQTIAAEPGLTLEIQDEPLRRIGPAHHTDAVAIDAV